MSVRPKAGEPVRFTVTQGHRVPKVGRPGQFYAAGTAYSERWSSEHDARLRTGAIVLAPEAIPAAPVAADKDRSGKEP